MSKLLGEDAYEAMCKKVNERTKPFKEVVFKIFKEKLRKNKNKPKYKHIFSLQEGEVIHINGIPCRYLGLGTFGSNTYPGKPRSVKGEDNEKSSD